MLFITLCLMSNTGLFYEDSWWSWLFFVSQECFNNNHMILVLTPSTSSYYSTAAITIITYHISDIAMCITY